MTNTDIYDYGLWFHLVVTVVIIFLFCRILGTRLAFLSHSGLSFWHETGVIRFFGKAPLYNFNFGSADINVWVPAKKRDFQFYPRVKNVGIEFGVIFCTSSSDSSSSRLDEFNLPFLHCWMLCPLLLLSQTTEYSILCSSKLLPTEVIFSMAGCKENSRLLEN